MRERQLTTTTTSPLLSRLSGLCLGLLVLAFSGCSTFHRDWKNAAATPTPIHDIAGRWQGNWQSDVNGHHGRLRCVVTKLEDGRYLARFHANYLRVLTFGYTVPLEVRNAGATVHFQGEADLGRLAGGKYTYEGQGTATNFFSTYRAKKDYGTFRMTRPSD